MKLPVSLFKASVSVGLTLNALLMQPPLLLLLLLLLLATLTTQASSIPLIASRLGPDVTLGSFSSTPPTLALAKRRKDCKDDYHVVTITGKVQSWAWTEMPGDYAIAGNICADGATAAGGGPGTTKVGGGFRARLDVHCQGSGDRYGNVDFVFVASGSSSAMPHGVVSGKFGGANSAKNVGYTVSCA